MTNKEKGIIVPYIKNGDKEPAEVKLQCVNWPVDFPYAPEVKVKLWHDGDTFHIEYEVDEEHVAALAESDNGEVWKDSCAEFFISFDDKGYYNLESNCIGKILLSHRKGRKEGVEYAGENILKKIERNPSLGDKPFHCRKGEGSWRLSLTVPAETFFKNDLKKFDGVKANCNIYKCGDNLPVPHFVSYFPIKTENPDFHRPEFFGNLYFAKKEDEFKSECNI